MDIFQLLQLDNFAPEVLAGLAVRFIFNVGMATVLILLVYRRNSKNEEFTFTLFAFNIIIFALCTILNNVELSIGSGFGLFAVFTMMRYRSEQMHVKDMTYLLVVVGLGFVNSTFQDIIGLIEIAFLNIGILIILFILEKGIFSRKLSTQKIKYENLEFLKLGNKLLLRQDLENRIGAQVVDVKIESVNYVDGCANLVVSYNQDNVKNEPNYVISPKINGHLKKEKKAVFVQGM
jgi:hypothetical protein